jgi:hypothetical protein
VDPFARAISYLHPTSQLPIKTPPDAKLERLRSDLTPAVSSRIDSQRKVCVLRSELEAAKGRNQKWEMLGEEARIPPQIFSKGATRNIGNDDDIDFMCDIVRFYVDPLKMASSYLGLTFHSNVRVLSLLESSCPDNLPPNKRRRRLGANECQIKDTAVTRETSP